MSADENRTPLDAEEQALARRYRGLPDGEPPPALDARIRAQARSAAHAGRPKLRPWAWGLSTAAAAVLALAMLWQTGLPPTAEDSVYRTLPGAAPEAVEPLLHEQAGAAGEERPQRAAVAPAADADAGANVEAPPPPPPAAPAATFERAPPPAQSMPERGTAAPPAPANRKAFAPPAAGTTTAAEPVGAPRARSEAAPQTAAEAATDVARTASRTEPTGTDAADALRHDPDAWLRHIAQLLADGRRDEAVEQLHAFREAHPDHALPQSLQVLLDSEAR